MEDRAAYIALNLMEGVGPITVRALATVLGSVAAIFKATRSALLEAPGVGPALAGKILAQRDALRPDREERQAEKLGARILTPVDPAYPAWLLQIHDPPLALYVRGELQPGDKRGLSIVGSRHCTAYGREVAEHFAFQLAKARFTVISGLARGIDTAAHRGALHAQGRTLAVLGGALDRIYPMENSELADRIAAQGAVLSEFPLGREPDKTTFPMRNRIVSGLSLGVVVVEAGLTSGALITANQALEQGRSVFAVPGRIDSPSSQGCHRLIRQGATLTDSVDVIIEDFAGLLAPATLRQARTAVEPPPPTLIPAEQRILDALRDGEQDVDTLSRAMAIPAGELGSLLLGLEMKRLIRMLPGRIVELVRKLK